MHRPEETIVGERHLKVTPLDLRQTRFKTAMRGFDREEVAAFLLEVADDYETAIRENDRLRTEVVKLEAMLDQHRQLEGSLRSTLVSAQKVADDMRDTASQEAARIVREAEGRAEMMVHSAQARVEDVQREIDGLRLKRREAETQVEATISALRSTLDFVRSTDDREEKIVLHRPRVEAAAFLA